MENKICFFSSNKRALYQEDIFRTLSLPKGYTLHFRYSKKWIENSVLDQGQRIIGKAGIVFYAHFHEGSEALEIISIRTVKVKEVVEDHDNELVHFFLELDDFTETPADSNYLKEALPPVKFVSQMRVADKVCSWINRIEVTQNLLCRQTFFYIRAVYTGNNQIFPSYSEYEKESYYIFDDQGEYYLEVNYADYSDGAKTFTYVTDEDKIFINVPQNFSLGALRDQRRHNVITHGISKSKVPALITIKTGNDTVAIKCIIKKDEIKSYVFGVFFAAAALAAVMVQAYSKIFLDTEFYKNFKQIIFPILLFVLFFSAAKLYHMFDKK